MRVLHVIDSLSASGGAEHGLVREITCFGPDTEQMVVTLFHRGELADNVEEAGIRVESLRFEANSAGWTWPLAAWRLRRLIRAFGPDVVQSSLFMGNLVTQLASRGLRIPVLSTFTLSGDESLLKAHQPGAKSWKATILRRVAAIAARSPRVIFRALTSDAKTTNCELLGVPLDRARVIPRGVPCDLETRPRRSRSAIGLPEDKRIIVNVGRQTAQKGHIYLVRAFAMLPSRETCHLMILGREGDGTRALIDEITAYDVGDAVTVLAYTPDVNDFLAHASVFAFPSVMEGLGTAVLEAMAAGVPVVGFDIPPVNELTEGGRYATLVPVGDVDALSAAIADVLIGRVPDVTAQARGHVCRSHSVRSIAERVEQLLQEVAGMGRDVAQLN